MRAVGLKIRRASAHGVRPPSRHQLLHVKDFLHHGESLAWAQIADGFKLPAHFLLPPLVDWILVEHLPCPIKVLNMHVEKEILTVAEDGVIGNSNFLQLSQ